MIHKTSCLLLLLPLTLIFFDFILISSLAKPTPITSLSVLTYGAKPDGSKDSTKAFLAAWQVACASPNPTTIIVPKGRFLVGNLVFQGTKCTNAPISFRIAGSIIAPKDFRVIANSLQWIMFDGVTNVSIYGGVLDAQGSSLWKCKNSGGKKCPTGAKTLLFTDSNNISIYGLTSINSQKFHIVIDQSNNVKIDGVKVSADADSPNTDGIHIKNSHSVNITNSRIGTGDDCISIGPGSTYVSIQGIQCGPGHGISIGSLGRSEDEQGVENVMVSNVDFMSTDNGVRIKTWGKVSKSFVRNIVFQHINMKMVKNPIIINQHYCLDKPCPKKESGVEISNVRYEDIQGTSNTEVAVMLDCSKDKPCTDIVMGNVNLVLQMVNGSAQASCNNANGLANDVVVPFTPCLKRDLLLT
ncbi:PREDICTED: probable polygalacturonase At2g43860 [Brassica oleracea var. oleracea]|uniref:Polygalacturonase n=1 Tax=Brassica oleracea var. oleracea TaxID=109376 RepID=A0A0D3C651_BRAOL|nr:PREDICTED: probable polygalacturonase At2g43860 [Brassica oleracea var. oleracea]